MKKWISILCLVLLFALGGSLACGAEESCRLSVLLEDQQKQPIEGLEVSACMVASLQEGKYLPASGFEGSGLSVSSLLQAPSAAVAGDLLAHIQKNNIPPVMAVSAAGRAIFADLQPGIWLVWCREGQNHRFDPYLVFLPYAANGEAVYQLSSAPKTAPGSENTKSIYLLKRWEDQNNAAQKRPETILVELLRNDAVVQRVTLSAGNGWAHTFSGLPKEGSYRVQERPVKGYTAEYSGDPQNGFIITNTFTPEEGRLPQTGQLWWPIGILAVAGLGFMALGLMELKGKKDEKSK